MIVSSTHGLAHGAAQPPPCGKPDANANLRRFVVQVDLLDPPRRLKAKELFVVLRQGGACHPVTIRYAGRDFGTPEPRRISLPPRPFPLAAGPQGQNPLQQAHTRSGRPNHGYDHPHEFLKSPYFL